MKTSISIPILRTKLRGLPAALLFICGALGAPVSAQAPLPPLILAFSFSEQPGFGFCPRVDTIGEALVLLEPPSRYTLVLSVYESVSREQAGDRCLRTIDEFDPASCLILRELPARDLGESEVADFLALLAEVESRFLRGPDELCGSSDPCLVSEFTWEDYRVSDEACDELRVRFDDVERIRAALQSLREADPGPEKPVLENGDVNGDEQRDLSDAVYLLNGLFTGGPAPLESRCPEIVLETCRPSRRVTRANGDTNGDSVRDIADAVRLLSWLFRSGDEPVALCECLDPPLESCGEACPHGEVCIPLWEEFGGPLCTGELSSCDEVRDVYDALVSRSEGPCDPEVGCHLLFGHCGIGLGGCYYALPQSVTQEQLDALSERFLELGGLESCPAGVCRCLPPPTVSGCEEDFCRFDR